MALCDGHLDRGKVRIHESLEELKTDLAEYIAEISEASVKERGVVAIALSGGHLIGLISHVHSIDDSVSAEKAAVEYEFLIRQSVKNGTVKVCDTSDCPSFDFILLGLGVDGHAASLFPNQSAMNEREEWVTSTTEFPKSPHEGITFTLPVINSASNVAVVATGDSKADVVHLAADNVGPEFPIVPARMIRSVKGKLVWLLDEPAASTLKPSLMSY